MVMISMFVVLLLDRYDCIDVLIYIILHVIVVSADASTTSYVMTL